MIDLVSGPNRCHIESCSVILASHGNAFIEPLLWLYRSRGEHKRVFAALTEERCGGVGAWSREQFYNWTADYLRWLWYQPDPALTALVLQNLRPVLEFDAEVTSCCLLEDSHRVSDLAVCLCYSWVLACL